MQLIPSLSVSLETLRQVALSLNRRELLKRRWGRRVADRHRKPRGCGPRSTRPLERVEIDHFLADVYLRCEHTGKILGRPWITLVVDHYSRMVLGYHITFAPPSAESVLAALRHAILPKDDD
jgi:putative transposase